MNYEQELATAINLLIEEKSEAFEAHLQKIFKTIKADIKQEPQNPQFEFWWAVGLEIRGDFDQALLKYENSLKKNPLFLDSWIGLTRILLEEMEKDQESLDLLEQKIMPLNNQDPRILDLYDKARISLGISTRTKNDSNTTNI
jgi:tetratricopeptide (TPR) repeat protein